MNVVRWAARSAVRRSTGGGIGGFLMAAAIVPYTVRKKVDPECARPSFGERVYTFVLAVVVVAGWGFGWWGFFGGLGVLAVGSIGAGFFFAAVHEKGEGK